MHMGIGTTHWASLGIHHGASFCRYPREERYGHKYHSTVIPIKDIKPVSLNHQVENIKGTNLDDLMKHVKKEFQSII